MPIPRALSTLKVPDRRALLQVPQNGIPYVEMPVHRESSKYPSGSAGGSPLQVPFIELPQREILHLQSPFSHILKPQ
jgi:hypothetical protein